MMKMMYEKPVMDVEQFMANEYFAACGDSGKIYQFNCDAGNGRAGDIFYDVNGNGVLDSGDENMTPGRGQYFHSCDKKHEAPSEDEFLHGFYVRNGGNDRLTHWGKPYQNFPVVIWTDGGRSVHATQNLDINSWETAKS